MKKHIYMMRHAQSFENYEVNGLIEWDTDLTDIGKKQAKLSSEWFSKNNVKFDLVFTSTYKRAISTFKEMNIKLEFSEKPSLNEYYIGELKWWRSQANFLEPFFFTKKFWESLNKILPETAEREEQFWHRISSTLSEISKSDKAQNILVVTHGVVISRFASEFLKESKYSYVPILKNCSIVKFEYENGTFKLADILNDY